MNVADTAQSTAVARAEQVDNCFGSNCVHQGLDLVLPKGEIIALVGGSGTGKTVLIHTLTMLRQPTRGRVFLFGEDINQASEVTRLALRRKIGLLFQGGALFTGMTVLENVMLPLREHTQARGAWLEELAMSKILLGGLPASAAAKYPSE